jgi:hypothetical protein
MLVYQTIEPLASHTVGTVYTVDFVARSDNLSRPLSVETKLDYRDGSYEFFVAIAAEQDGRRRRHNRKARQVIRSRSKSGQLHGKHVSRIDPLRGRPTGVIPLRGTAWIDDVALVVTKR